MDIFPLINLVGEGKLFRFWHALTSKYVTYEFSKYSNCLRIFFNVQFLMSRLRENCRETTNKHIKIRKLLFTKKCNLQATGGADLNGEGELLDNSLSVVKKR